MSADRDELPLGSEAILGQAGFIPPYTGRRLTGGRNNRVFGVRDGAGRQAVVKAYFHDPEDPRDRLGTEFDFLLAAERLGIGAVPKPLGRDSSQKLGVYSYVEGEPLVVGNLTPAVLSQALRFVSQLNDRSRWNQLPPLPDAADSAWTATETMARIDHRLNGVRTSLGDSPIEREAAAFVSERLLPLWDRVRVETSSALEAIGLPTNSALPRTHRVLSPADFGLQNALRGAEGNITFLDFEYAGWDDPAKFVSDTFHQFEVPMPEDFYPTFCDTIAGWFPDTERQRRRCDLMMPVHGVKWIAIILNEFNPASNRRRTFADTGDMRETRLPLQLARAFQKYNAINRSLGKREL